MSELLSLSTMPSLPVLPVPMPKRRLLMLAALATAAAASSVAQAAAHGSAPEGAVRELVARFVAAWNRHDAPAMAATYAETGSLVDPFKAMRGRVAIEKGFGGLHAGPAKTSNSDMVVSSIEALSADLLFVDATQTVTGMLAPDGKTLPPTTFLLTMVLQREPAGWAFRAVRVMFAPPPKA